MDTYVFGIACMKPKDEALLRRLRNGLSDDDCGKSMNIP